MLTRLGETEEQSQEITLHDFSFLRWYGLSAEAAAAWLGTSLRTLQRASGRKDPRVWRARLPYRDSLLTQVRCPRRLRA
jgi:hypothetical protein